MRAFELRKGAGRFEGELSRLPEPAMAAAEVVLFRRGDGLTMGVTVLPVGVPVGALGACGANTAGFVMMVVVVMVVMVLNISCACGCVRACG